MDAEADAPGKFSGVVRLAACVPALILPRNVPDGFLLISMKTPLSLPLNALALVAASVMPAFAAEPDGDQILRQTSAKLAASKSLSFTADREIDSALLGGRNLPGKARVQVSVLRPNKIAARSESKDGVRHVLADGRSLTVWDEKTNHYARVPMRTTIDGLVDRLDEKYGFVPPLAEFAVSDPYAHFRREAHSVSYLGRAKFGAGFLGLGGVECHRLALGGKTADAELWVAVEDQLPRKLVATFKNSPGKPQVRIRFVGWNTAAPVTAFTFTPPKGSEKVEMWTTQQMASAASKPQKP